jgi:hypothetical protein
MKKFTDIINVNISINETSTASKAGAVIAKLRQLADNLEHITAKEGLPVPASASFNDDRGDLRYEWISDNQPKFSHEPAGHIEIEFNLKGDRG